VMNSLCPLMLCLLVIATILIGEAYADMFEFLTYTPPRGWINQALKDGSAYRRASGIGLITFYASYPATGSASDEFARMWRARVEPALPGPAPQPQLHREGDYSVVSVHEAGTRTGARRCPETFRDCGVTARASALPSTSSWPTADMSSVLEPSRGGDSREDVFRRFGRTLRASRRRAYDHPRSSRPWRLQIPRAHLRRVRPWTMDARYVTARRERETGVGSAIYANRGFPLIDAL
jgi:hypothetical protein